MSHSKTSAPPLEFIVGYVENSKGLSLKVNESGRIDVLQELDKKYYYFHSLELAEVLPRLDSEGKDFLQINFKNGTKVLFTDNLIGFKPVEMLGLDMSRLPKVVTTPDLMSVCSALEDAIDSDAILEQDVEVLKKVYQSILMGAEKVGFNLEKERKWINRILASRFRASA